MNEAGTPIWVEVQQAREAQGLSQYGLAEDLGISQSQLSAIERGVGWETFWLRLMLVIHLGLLDKAVATVKQRMHRSGGK